MDTFKCLDFRATVWDPVRSCKEPDPKCQAHPQCHLTCFSQEGGRLPRKMVQYQGEEMNQAEPPLSVPARLPPCLLSLAVPPALLSLSSPSPFFSASSLASSLLFDLPLFLFTFPAACGHTEIEDGLKCLPQGHCSGEGRGGGTGCVCVHMRVCMCVHAWVSLLSPSLTRVPHTQCG